MSIKHIRIDERLIHGQVASAWSNTLNITRIMVINDEANKDEFTKKMLRMATPSQIALSVLSNEKALDRITNGNYDNDVVLIVLKSVTDALTLINLGLPFKSINIGNCSSKDNTKALVKGVYINSEDQKAIDELKAMNVKVTVQMTPQDAVKIL